MCASLAGIATARVARAIAIQGLNPLRADVAGRDVPLQADRIGIALVLDDVSESGEAIGLVLQVLKVTVDENIADRVAHADLVSLVFGAVRDYALSPWSGGLVRIGDRSGGRKSATSGQQSQVSTGDLRQSIQILMSLVGSPNLNRNSRPDELAPDTPDVRVAQR